MFCVVGAVAVMFAPHASIPHLIPSVGVRLFLTGLLLGGAGSLVAITPLGRISGAHLNPAISLGFFTYGRMHAHDLLGYMVAQVAGASLGAWCGKLLFVDLAAAVHCALNQPGHGVSPFMALGGEVAATFVLAAVVFAMVSRQSLMHWTPLAVVGVVAVIVWVDGNFSGASLNPARSFGPVVVTDDWHLFWVYVLGPCTGSAVAALLLRFGTLLEIKTGKLFHDLHYRSIFTGESDHAANRHLRSDAGGLSTRRPPVHGSRDSMVDGRPPRAA